MYVAGPPVEVGVTMYVLSISSVSEVLMVHTQKNLPTKNILQTKKEMETFIFLFKKKSKVKPKKSISSTSRQLLNLPLFVCLSLFPTINQYLLLSLYSYSSLSLSVSLCSCFTHNLCNICSYIISLFKSKKKHIHCVEISFHFIVDFLHSFWNKANCKITNAYTPIIQYILIYKHILKFLPIKCCVNNCFAMPCQFVNCAKIKYSKQN